MKAVSVWLDEKLAERQWSDADLSRASGVYTGTISNVRSRNKIGPEVARKFAKAFKMREDDLFYELGLLSQAPGEVVIHDPILADLWRMFHAMSEQERIAARVFVEKMFGHLLDDDVTVEGRAGAADRPVGEDKKSSGRRKQTTRRDPEKAKPK